MEMAPAAALSLSPVATTPATVTVSSCGDSTLLGADAGLLRVSALSLSPGASDAAAAEDMAKVTGEWTLFGADAGEALSLSPEAPEQRRETETPPQPEKGTAAPAADAQPLQDRYGPPNRDGGAYPAGDVPPPVFKAGELCAALSLRPPAAMEGEEEKVAEGSSPQAAAAGTADGRQAQRLSLSVSAGQDLGGGGGSPPLAAASLRLSLSTASLYSHAVGQSGARAVGADGTP